MNNIIKIFYVSILNNQAEFKKREYINANFFNDVAGNYILKRYIWVAKNA